MNSYIKVLTTEMRHAIAKDMSLVSHTYIPTKSNINKLLLADINSEDVSEIYNE